MKTRRLRSIVSVRAKDYSNNILSFGRINSNKLDGSELDEDLDKSKETTVRAFQRIFDNLKQPRS